MELDAVFLSRVQFALTIMFHYLFPPLSIGLGVMMVFMEGMYLKTRDPLYQAMTKFWVKIFAANFAVGVATGIVMEFQFGTNWSKYSRYVGDVFGSALAAEGIFAFFLESGFLAVLVFGWDRVSPRMHFFATCMVALGSIFSAVWIVIANSWMQTPAGHEIVTHVVNGVTTQRAEIVDFWAMVFNPSSMHRLIHVILGAFVLGAFFVMSISAWYLLKRKHEVFARKAFTIGLLFGEFSLVAISISGHFQARAVAANQPAKLAALEAILKTDEGGTPMYIIGWPNEKEGRVDFAIEIPGLLSFLVHDDPTKPVKGFDQLGPGGGPLPDEDRPPVLVPFVTYHAMIGLGVLLLLLNTIACFFWWRGTLFEKRGLLWLFVFAVIAPYIANQAGWVCAEVGRQPWVVYGLLRTKDAVSPSVKGGEVMASIVMFSVVYLLLFVVWVYVINSKIQHGPDAADMAVAPEVTPEGGLKEAVTRLQKSTGYSMTGTQEEGKP